MNMEDYEKAIAALEGVPDPVRRKDRDIEGLLRKARSRLLGTDY
jgi:hypothetical protein